MSTNRHPAGTPSGGRFAAGTLAEADIDLGDDLDSTCEFCGRANDDGKGWDGQCRRCADLAYNHDEGEHSGEPDDDCPLCDG